MDTATDKHAHAVAVAPSRPRESPTHMPGHGLVDRVPVDGAVAVLEVVVPLADVRARVGGEEFAGEEAVVDETLCTARAGHAKLTAPSEDALHVRSLGGGDAFGYVAAKRLTDP
jgi:hypothetical protein